MHASKICLSYIFITYMFQSGYLHKNTDKTQQNVRMCLYFLPDDGRMKHRNMSQKMIINERTVFRCCIRVDWIAND